MKEDKIMAYSFGSRRAAEAEIKEPQINQYQGEEEYDAETLERIAARERRRKVRSEAYPEAEKEIVNPPLIM